MVQEALQGAVVASQDDNTPDDNIAIYFDVIKGHTININNSITDNYLEDNTPVSDTIAHSPLTVTLSGVSGELVYVPSIKGGALKYLYDSVNLKLGNINSQGYVVTDKLLAIPQLYPPLDNVTQAAKNAVELVETAYNRAKNIIDNLKGNRNSETRLEEIYRKLMLLRTNNTSLVVVTPYKTLQKMYIQDITLSQQEQNYITDISIIVKQINFTSVETTEANKDVLAKYNDYARAQVENGGVAQGRNADNSLLYQTFGNNARYKVAGQKGSGVYTPGSEGNAPTANNNPGDGGESW